MSSIQPTRRSAHLPGAAFGFVMLAFVCAGIAWGLWRFFIRALDPSTSIWLPGLILLVLSIYWVLSAAHRRSAERDHTTRMIDHKAAAYSRAITDTSPASIGHLALWASPDVLRDYAAFADARSRDPEAPFPADLLVAMRRDLGHSQPELSGVNLGPLLTKPPHDREPGETGRQEPATREAADLLKMKMSAKYPGSDSGLPPSGRTTNNGH